MENRRAVRRVKVLQALKELHLSRVSREAVATYKTIVELIETRDSIQRRAQKVSTSSLQSRQYQNPRSLLRQRSFRLACFGAKMRAEFQSQSLTDEISLRKERHREILCRWSTVRASTRFLDTWLKREERRAKTRYELLEEQELEEHFARGLIRVC